MNDYILFLDTETSDKPKYWNAPTDEVDHWPYILQIAWTICKKSGETVLTHDYYINPGDIKMSEESMRVHGITLDFLKKNGIKREEVLQQLSDDLEKFNPLVVGHFLKFDIKMIEVGFNRAGIKQSFLHRPRFCTMFVTRSIFLGANSRLLRLNELYKSLFGAEFKNQHNALYDALAAKDCFFELLKKGQIKEKEFIKQAKYFKEKHNSGLLKKVVMPSIILVIIIFVLYLLLVSI
ncbi:3'-5' exonuclease [Plebeiibacterium sediminum]|uniref:3'-5' exonuclease n=1 Tax=Plebeiibacterium sediminum TaxID=2992112 RepID=A0AAE3SET2_9BACT|nr:3'-5' exonuclease [Plebeiobacterium sediminum]MCW3786332.1 3'-5' exonuclease [Plebeiobacterium sediminum]